jgi:hypothetical protein
VAEDDEKKAGEGEGQTDEGDGGEAAFWTRLDERLQAAVSDDRLDASLTRVLSKLDAEVEAEDKSGKTAKGKESGSDDGDGGSDERSEAERRREGGRVGPGSRSPYWQRVSRALYGR